MYIGDLHIHSHYSRATSKDLTPEYLDLWARKKGIDIVGTGDFTHPAWRAELAEKLEPAEPGLYILKRERTICHSSAPGSRQPRFVISGEISSIYKKNDKVRKVHSLILLPSLEAAEILSKRLEAIGNIHSDGRPILGLDCHDLLAITLDACPEAIYVPAHIWTPHFSLFGAFSGFDTIEECYGELTPQIHALETGLSSDPSMNQRLSALDSFHLISNSDAHSPAKLGREANLFDIPMSYDGLYGAIQRGEGLAGTIEFFPEEGKYHFDGHRKCHLCLSPSQARQYNGICPVCGKKLTTGVLHRIEQLADRREDFILPGGRPYENLVPLPEVIAACMGSSSASVKVTRQYEHMLEELGSEFHILRSANLDDISRIGGQLTAQGIRHLREGKVDWRPGYDGEYGTMKLFAASELDSVEGQLSFLLDDNEIESFTSQANPDGNAASAGQAVPDGHAASTEYTVPGGHTASAGHTVPGGHTASAGHTVPGGHTASAGHTVPSGHTASAGHTVPGGHAASCKQTLPASQTGADVLDGLNPNQRQAVGSISPVTAVIAGPGTGKTKTLVSRLSYLIGERGVKPAEITAVTFTNKAAEELRQRIRRQLPGKRSLNQMQVGTFHSLCYRMLQNQGTGLSLADEGQQQECAAQVTGQLNLPVSPSQLLSLISLKKSGTGTIPAPAGPSDEDGKRLPTLTEEAFSRYNELLASRNLMDFDDLLLKVLELLGSEQKLELRRQHFFYLLVDEFQDISPVQYRLIKAWNKGGKELFLIGDPDQSIYGFRGSQSNCFDQLCSDYSQACVLRLKPNYRSTPEILSAALPLISHNPGEPRELTPMLGHGAPVRVATAESSLSEAIFIAKEIGHMVGGIDMLDAHANTSAMTDTPRSFSDIAILYRTNHQARLLEQCLRKEGIPYVVAGREDYLGEPSVQGTICFFHGIASSLPDSEEIWSHTTSLCRKLLGPCHDYEALKAQFTKRLKREKPWKLLEDWMKILNLTDNRSMDTFLCMSYFHKTMEDMLTTLTFGQGNDVTRSGQDSCPSSAVTLMTFHASKGLEFPTVFLYGLKQGLMPLKSGSGPVNLEEERRLLYVAMTRAKEELIITTSESPSSFLSEIPPNAFRPEQARTPASGIKQLSLFDFMD